jgi:hypothetical protein
MLAFPMRPSPGLVFSPAHTNCSGVPPLLLSRSIETAVRPLLRAPFARPVFSSSYKSLFRQALCIHILTKHPGVYPLGLPSSELSPLSAAPFLEILVLSVTCRLLVSLAALFRARPLYFQSLADSFAKYPGGWGTRARHAVSASPHLPQRNVDADRTSNYHYCKFQVPGSWMKLPN